jgi:hypothetical protein
MAQRPLKLDRSWIYFKHILFSMFHISYVEKTHFTWKMWFDKFATETYVIFVKQASNIFQKCGIMTIERENVIYDCETDYWTSENSLFQTCEIVLYDLWDW